MTIEPGVARASPAGASPTGVSPAGASTVGVLLAGGLSRRMGGGDKCLRMLGDKTILARIVERTRPQVAALALNANGDARRFADYALPVVADSIEGFAGPLAGILAGMDWAAAQWPGAQWLASFATDAPFVPTDLVDRLARGIREHDADMACARSGGQSHPVFALWPIALRGILRAAMLDHGVRKVDAFTRNYRLVEVDFAIGVFDPFYNVNHPDDLAVAERALTK